MELPDSATRCPSRARDHQRHAQEALAAGPAGRGTRRTFLVYRPAILPAAAPLVVMLHGGFGTGAQAEKSYHWDTEADRAHFVVAYPDGLDRAWNTGGGCCGVPGRNNADDVGFITAMISAIEHELPSTALNATQVIWRFFAAHPRPGR
jgi:poly(3-hydroxybutyrate) depolymerase